MCIPPPASQLCVCLKLLPLTQFGGLVLCMPLQGFGPWHAHTRMLHLLLAVVAVVRGACAGVMLYTLLPHAVELGCHTQGWVAGTA